MQNKKADEMSDFIVDNLITYFGVKAKNFSIYNIEDEPYTTFSIDFLMYDFYIVNFTYDRGIFGFSIKFGERQFVSLDEDESKINNETIVKILDKLKEEVELRIPDKFLKARGWL